MGLESLLAIVEAKQVDKVLVTEISRLGRRTLEILTLVDRITSYGVSIYIGNYGVETLRENTIDRIQSGLSHAKQHGVRLGRPFGSVKNCDLFLKQYKGVVKSLLKGLSVRDAAKVNNVSINTVMKVKKSMQTLSFH